MGLDCPRGKFKKGDIVRYENGETALMRLSEYSGGHWYGEQFFGDTESQRFFFKLRKATAEERKSYRAEEKRRHRKLAKELRSEISKLKKRLKELRP